MQRRYMLMNIKKIFISFLKLTVTVYLFNAFGYLIVVAGSEQQYSLSDAFSPIQILAGIFSGNIRRIMITLLGIIFFSLFKYWRTTKVDYLRGGRGRFPPY